MGYSINDKIREYILGDKKLNIIFKKINNLDNKTKEYVLRLLLSDYFKINYINYINTGISNKLSIFNNTIEHNLNMCMQNNSFLLLVLSDANCFFTNSLLNKIMIIEKMDKRNLDQKLTYINKFHFLDKFSYKFSYDLEDLKKYYIDSINSENDPLSEHNTTSTIILNKITKLEYRNTDMYEEYIMEFIREYCKWNFYRKNNLKIKPKFEDNYNYLDNIYNCSIDALLYFASKDHKFLFTLISNYLYYTSLPNTNEKELVDKYFKEHASTEVQKKLNKIKRDIK